MKTLSYNATKYGILLTLVPVFCLLVMELTGNNQSFENVTWWDTALQIILTVIILTLGIRAKKKELGGLMSWKQGVVSGFEISLIFGLISPFVFLAYYVFVNYPIVASVREVYHLKNATDLGVIRIDMLMQFVTALIFGLVVSSIASLFLRSRTPKS